MLFRSCCFCINYILAVLALFAAMAFLNTLPGLHGGASVLLTLPLIVAAVIEGQAFARSYHVRPSSYQCWMTALRMLAWVVVIVVGWVIICIVINPSNFSQLQALEPWAMGRSLALGIVCAWLLLRFGYSIGLASVLKGQQISNR